MNTVTFFGHAELSRTEKENIAPHLYETVENLIQEGADTFLLGGYGDFDRLCAETVKKLKEKYPDIVSILVIPYIDRDFDKELYDYSDYPPIEKTPKKYAIVRRNEYMIQNAETVVIYMVHTFGGAYNAMKYATAKKKKIIHLAYFF